MANLSPEFGFGPKPWQEVLIRILLKLMRAYAAYKHCNLPN